MFLLAIIVVIIKNNDDDIYKFLCFGRFSNTITFHLITFCHFIYYAISNVKSLVISLVKHCVLIKHKLHQFSAHLCTMDFPMETRSSVGYKSSAQAHSVDIRCCM